MTWAGTGRTWIRGTVGKDVTAVGPVIVMSMGLEHLKSAPELASIHRHILANISKILSERIRRGKITEEEFAVRVGVAN